MIRAMNPLSEEERKIMELKNIPVHSIPELYEFANPYSSSYYLTNAVIIGGCLIGRHIA